MPCEPPPHPRMGRSREPADCPTEENVSIMVISISSQYFRRMAAGGGLHLCCSSPGHDAPGSLTLPSSDTPLLSRHSGLSFGQSSRSAQPSSQAPWGLCLVGSREVTVRRAKDFEEVVVLGICWRRPRRVIGLDVPWGPCTCEGWGESGRRWPLWR